MITLFWVVDHTGKLITIICIASIYGIKITQHIINKFFWRKSHRRKFFSVSISIVLNAGLIQHNSTELIQL